MCYFSDFSYDDFEKMISQIPEDMMDGSFSPKLDPEDLYQEFGGMCTHKRTFTTLELQL